MPSRGILKVIESIIRAGARLGAPCVAILVPGVQVAKAQALELTVVVPRETTSGR